MAYDPNDTIAAISTATHGAARGMVRLSGPQVLDALSKCFDGDQASLNLTAISVPTVIHGSLRIRECISNIPCDLFLWPSARSYTRQPTAELHTLGSPPLLEAVVHTLCECGTRIAEPGEFTLRAFLAGRLDLTQAEAVLGVIDARSQRALDTALSQLAGGLSQPLSLLREQLLQILAELEAGLDFAEEDLEFISRDHLSRQLTGARQLVSETLEQLAGRTSNADIPRVVLTGPPNVGKSSLFNALVDLCVANNSTTRALVSERSGTTRDYVTAVVDLGGITCELVDTAGEEDSVSTDSIDSAAQSMGREQRELADLRVWCLEASEAEQLSNRLPKGESPLVVLTKADLTALPAAATESAIACSSQTGMGVEAVRERIRQRVEGASLTEGTAVASTAARCAESLHRAEEALQRTLKLCAQSGVEELIAAEVRDALGELGRVVGAVYTDDVLDRIFSQFCIGK